LPRLLAARPCAARVLSLRMEEVGLGVLVNAQRDDVQHASLGDAGDPFPGGLHRRQAEVVADDGEGGLPGDALHGGLGEVGLGRFGMALALQVGQHSLGRFAAVEDTLEEADGPRPLGHWRRAAEGKAHASGAQVVRFL
jgi:hypothetical protein